MYFLSLGLSYKATGHILTMIVLTALLCGLSFFYSVSIRKSKNYSELNHVSFLIFSVVQWIKRNTYQILGKSYRIAVPFFIYIISIFWFSNIISILGFESLGNSIVVPATLAVVVFFGTIVSGLIFRGRRFFGDYVIWIRFRRMKIFPIVDPLKLLGELSKILSLTCRLWGNTLAGSLILFVVYHFAENLFSYGNIKFLGPIIIPIFVFPLHIYFDIIDGTIQPLIFMLLTMCYWSIAKHGEGDAHETNIEREVNTSRDR